jgi:hypothetical protein
MEGETNDKFKCEVIIPILFVAVDIASHLCGRYGSRLKSNVCTELADTETLI